MQLQVTGQLIGMEPRNGGWVAVVVQDPAEQYPKKMSTKQPQLLQQAQQLMTQMVTALYTESDSNNINPNTGLPYVNRNLNQLTLANGAAPQPIAAQQPQQVTFTPQQPLPVQPQFQQGWAQPAQPPVLTQRVSDSEREARIHRQTATKVAATLLQYLDKEEQNLASHLRLSEQLVHYYVNGVTWSVPPPVPSPIPVYTGHDPQDGPQPTQEQQMQNIQPTGAALPDDDIPFAPTIF